MWNSNTLILERSDLQKQYADKHIVFLSFEHFKKSFNLFYKESIIIFIDNDGQTKILKNRYGNQGVILI